MGDTVGGYVKAALVICVCAIPFTLICCGGTKEVVYPPASQKVTAKALFQNVIQNPPLIIMLVGFFVCGFMGYGRMTVALYYFTYVLGGAVGPALLGVLLGVAGYIGGSETQTESALAMINGCMNLMPAILAALAIVSLLFYKLDGELHQKIRDELAAREQETANS